MTENLTPIERALERLEADVVHEYDTAVLEAARRRAARVVLDETTLDRLTSELDRLKESLYATGDPTRLSLVSDHHDVLRIRMIYVQHLLEREIPRPYADEALQDRPVEAARAPRAAAPTTKAGDAGLFDRLFGREKPQRAVPPSPTLASNEMRLNHLHQLMREDHLNLLKETERVPLVPEVTRANRATNNAIFTTKDVGETHHERARPEKQIARTPEELRAKLAKRESDARKPEK